LLAWEKKLYKEVKVSWVETNLCHIDRTS
jgi:hypothetical protein